MDFLGLGNWKGSDTSTHIFAARNKRKASVFSVLFCSCEYMCRFKLYFVFYGQRPDERLELKQFCKEEKEAYSSLKQTFPW